MEQLRLQPRAAPTADVQTAPNHEHRGARCAAAILAVHARRERARPRELGVVAIEKKPIEDSHSNPR
jgi:hypothetical protein